ncbi:MAG: glutamate racemase [Clostridia bacterium]|nr:glutamate racemase [Clostridia bacterium]
MDKRPIGIFDSGVGGMTVLAEIKKRFPNEDLIYLGDTKNFPYGDKSRETIIKLATKCAGFLISQDVKLIVIACGTATSQALEELKKIYKVPIVGIITPTIINIKRNTNPSKETRVGVIATEGTIRSNKWEEELLQEIENVKVFNKACPLLAPMAEQGWTTNNVAKEAIKEYMKPFIDKKLDKIILGCTHYPLFKELIQKELGNDVEIINTGEKIADYLEEYLVNEDIENSKNHDGECSYYLTDTECNFIQVASRLLQDKEIRNNIQKMNIE